MKEALQKHRPLDGKAGTAGVLVNNFIAGVIGGTVSAVGRSVCLAYLLLMLLLCFLTLL